MEGWIKWHRKILDNEIRRFDPTAWRVFEYICLWADKRTGKMNSAIRTIAQNNGLPLSTTHDAINRLVTARMLNTRPNANFTTFTVQNWGQYQSTPNAQPNADRTQTEHIQEREVLVFSDNTRKIAELLNVEPTKGLDRYLNELYPKYKFKALTIKMVEWCKENKKTPTVSRWMNWVRRAADRGELERRDE